MTKPQVAVIGTGGTIASIGQGPLDLLDYGANETMLHVDEIIARFPEVYEVADILPVRFEAIPSPNIFFPEWKALVLQIERAFEELFDVRHAGELGDLAADFDIEACNAVEIGHGHLHMRAPAGRATIALFQAGGGWWTSSILSGRSPVALTVRSAHARER